MSFLSSLFGGSNPTLNQQMGTLGTIAGTATSAGQADISSASNLWNQILAGDTSKILAPQTSAIQKQGQQKLQALSQFGTRSGGTAAEAATTGDTTKANINDLIASLTGSAASSLGSMGQNLLNTGLGAYGQQAGVSQQQMKNWQDSIFGGALTGGVGLALGKAGSALGLAGF